MGIEWRHQRDGTQRRRDNVAGKGCRIEDLLEVQNAAMAVDARDRPLSTSTEATLAQFEFQVAEHAVRA